MMKLLRRVRLNKNGASAAEYAMILAVVSGGAVTAAVTLSNDIGTAMTQVGSKMVPGGGG